MAQKPPVFALVCHLCAMAPCRPLRPSRIFGS